MKILHFEAEKLHGYLSFELDFQSDLAFLTGINGSGKTSAIRCIRSLLAPSLIALGELRYERISVTISEANETATIASWRQSNEICLSFTGIDETLRIPALAPESFESSGRYSKRQRNYFRDQEIKNADNPIFSAITKLPTPMYLDIERRYQESANIRRAMGGLEATTSSTSPLTTSPQEGTKAAQALAEGAFREYLDARSKQTDILKQEIVLAAFRPTKSSGLGVTIPQPDEKREALHRIGESEKVLPSVLSQIGISDSSIEKIVLPFFRDAKSAVEKVPIFSDLPNSGALADDLVRALQNWSAVQPQVRQIEKLVELIDSYNTEIAKLFSPIRAYLDSVNGFLNEAGKSITLDPSGLAVSVDEDRSRRPIYELSSGEKQMVVILTQLAFNKQAKLANVLIIDEPELSLHIRWQELFVDAVMSASPGLQVILATHSPSIIRGRIDKCIDVSEARRSDSLFGGG